MEEPNRVSLGDSLEVLKTLPANSVDLLCTDPPYGYSFMGKSWDKALPSVEIWRECLRVLKPGAFAFIMSAPRSDVLSRMIVRIEDAGFRVDFTPIYWTYASGFPKAMNIGKMVDKRNGTYIPGEITPNSRFSERDTDEGSYSHSKITRANNLQSDQAKTLDGSYGGFQPKPAVEVIIVAMKPLSEKTYVDQALKNGKGITWLDEGRIPTNWKEEYSESWLKSGKSKSGEATYQGRLKTLTESTIEERLHKGGRFPANLLVEDAVLNGHSKFFDLDAWAKTLPFLIVPKASKGEKNRGLDRRTGQKVNDGRQTPIDNPFQRAETERKNIHPTVKPLKLMSYLITLGSRPNDLVLDPFLGSGTTAIAAKELGRKYIGIEREEEYVNIAEARLKATEARLI